MKFRDPASAGDDYDSDEELTELSLDASGYDAAGQPSSQQPSPAGSGFEGDRRAHHNMLERKRRDHIKDSFLSLKDNVPNLTGEKASRTQILQKACDYIVSMRDKIADHNADIAHLREQNAKLEAQVRCIEEARRGVRCEEAASAAALGLRTGAVGIGSTTSHQPDPGHDYLHPQTAPEHSPAAAAAAAVPNGLAPLPRPNAGEAMRVIRVSMPSGTLLGSGGVGGQGRPLQVQVQAAATAVQPAAQATPPPPKQPRLD